MTVSALKSISESSFLKSSSANFLLIDDMNDSNKKNSDYPPIPDWVIVGESILIRPYNTSGVIEFVGPTHFQVASESFHLLFL